MKIPETNPYLEFVKKHFHGGDYIVNWHHAVTSYYIDQWVQGKIRWLILEYPPQYGKSELGSMMLAPYVFKEFPTARFAYTTYAFPLAKRMSKTSKNIMRSEAYRQEFNDLTVPLSFRSLDLWENSLGGVYTGQGRDGSISGTPQDFIVCDDLFKNYDEAMSPVIRESAWFWFVTVALRRLSPKGRALLFFTRWNSDDVIGRCLKLMNTNSKVARPWIRLSFPGLMTEELFKNKHPADPRQIGEALWPWKETVDELETVRMEQGEAAFNATYQQTPVNEKGTKINPEWFRKISRADVPKGLRWNRYYRFGELQTHTIDKKNATCLMAKGNNGEYFVSDVDYFDEDWPSCLNRLKRVGKSERRVKVGFQKTGGSRKTLFEQVKDCKREVRKLKSFDPVNPLVWTPDAQAGKMCLVEDENTVKCLEACRNYTGSGRDKREAEIQALAGAHNMISSQRSIVQILAEKNKKLQAKRKNA